MRKKKKNREREELIPAFESLATSASACLANSSLFPCTYRFKRSFSNSASFSSLSFCTTCKKGKSYRYEQKVNEIKQLLKVESILRLLVLYAMFVSVCEDRSMVMGCHCVNVALKPKNVTPSENINHLGDIHYLW